MCKRSPQEQHQAPSHQQNTSFITPAARQTQPLQSNLRKSLVSLTPIIFLAPLLITTLISITQFFPTPTVGPRAPPTQTHSNPHHQDTISVGSTLPFNHPPPSTIQPEWSANCKNRTDYPWSIFFLFQKRINLNHQLDNTAGATGSAKRMKQVYWSKTRINQWLFTKSKDGHKQHNRSPQTNITITSRYDHQQYQQLPPARTIRIVKDNNNKGHFVLHRYLCHHHKGNLQQQKQVD